jgi:hypothetical protein
MQYATDNAYLDQTLMFQSTMSNSTDVGQQAVGPQSGDQIHLKLLVIAAESSDQNLQAIRAVLDQIGVPYDTLIATAQALTQRQLWQEREAFYQGIILTTGNLLYWHPQNESWQSAFDEATWQLLWHYQLRFGIRQVVLYAVGTVPEAYGLQRGVLIATEPHALSLSFTEAGRCLFPYLNHDHGLIVRAAPVYLAQPLDAATIPLLQTPDGQTVAILRHEPDGRELVALTIGHSPDLLHTWLLGYGLINWVTRGLFLGERRVYLNIQIDDIFNRSELWNPTQECAGTDIYRLSERDAKVLLAWLDQVQSQTRNGAQITLDFAFNGAGIIGAIEDDALATTLLEHQQRFRWINHGYTHLLLDHATYAESQREILANHQTAVTLDLHNYEATTMVTAVVSGLENNEFLRAAKDAGMRALVSDTSKAGWDSPSPNTGICNPLQPTILCIPRRPTNLFYDVSTPDEWVAKYNHIYHGYWGRDLDLWEIIEQEAEFILRYLLKFEINPLMFHQANLRAYDGLHSLLSLLIDRILVKYNALYGDVPIQCLGMHEIGAAMHARAAYNAAQVEAVWIVEQGVALVAQQDLTISITGLYVEKQSEWYAGQPIARLPIKANVAYQFPPITQASL